MYTRPLAAMQFLLVGSHGIQIWASPRFFYTSRAHGWSKFASAKRTLTSSAAPFTKVQQRSRALLARASETISDDVSNAVEGAVGGRHVIFMSRYSVLRGEPLFALFDQLVARSCQAAGETVLLYKSDSGALHFYDLNLQ